jgi:hypothetical protein
MSTQFKIGKTSFYPKRWYIFLFAMFFTMMAIFCAILGPMSLLDLIKRADGKSGREAGIALSIFALPFSLLALLGWFRVYASFHPLLRICNDGLEINVIGASSLDGVPFIPSWIRVALLVVSLQGFKKQIGWIPWDSLRNVELTGLPMLRALTIEAAILYPSIKGDTVSASLGDKIVFCDAEFKDPLESVYKTILMYHQNPEARTVLPSLHD